MSFPGIGAQTSTVNWGSLTDEQKAVGLHPEQLEKLDLSFTESPPSAAQLEDIRRLFAASRVGMSLAESVKFLSVFAATTKTHQLAKEVISQVFQMTLPPEEKLDCDDPSDFLSFEGKDQFPRTYNVLIEGGRAHLMHPARCSELLEVLPKMTKNIDRFAQQLIQFRCFGHNGLCLREETAVLQNVQTEKERLQRALVELPPKEEIMVLSEDQLSCIEDQAVRKYVVLVYHRLREAKSFKILDLPERDLYRDYGSETAPAHPFLKELFQSYYLKERRISFNFGQVVIYARQLKECNLSDLKRFVLKEQLARTEDAIMRFEGMRNRLETIYNKGIALYAEKVKKEYPSGDFSFIEDEVEQRMLTNAFLAVERLKLWSRFDRMKSIYGLPGLIEELHSDDHSGVTFAFVMGVMEQIRREGWEEYVRKSVEAGRKKVGLLNSMIASLK